MADPAGSAPQLPAVGALAIVRFVSELGLLGALGYVGWQLAGGGLIGTGLAVALPLLAAAVWGSFVGPRAAHRLRDPARLVVEVALFGLAVSGVVAYGAWPAGAVLAVMYTTSTVHGRRGG